jgi:hypothetical protein
MSNVRGAFEIENRNLINGPRKLTRRVIPSAAVFQAERGISRAIVTAIWSRTARLLTRSESTGNSMQVDSRNGFNQQSIISTCYLAGSTTTAVP